MKLKKIALLIAAGGLSAPVFATNGMNMEGYGPVATGMGGASFAYDNGNAGMINNPATLGYMQSGTSRFDIAVGSLKPSVGTSSNGSSLDSSAGSFMMPAFGYIRKDGALAWGVGMMAQGGMGTEYANGSFWGRLNASGDMNTGALGPSTAPSAADLAAGASLRNMSEVGVGRVIFPLAYEVNDKLRLGGSIDYVWAGMDIQWLIDGANFADMMGGTRRFGSIAGSMVTAFQGAMGPTGCGATPCFDQMTWGYFDFNKTGKFSQAAKGNGWAGNLGFTYQVSPALAIGGVYHAKTNISDMKTDGNFATVSFNVNMAGVYQTIPVTGRVTVKDFQWPETFGLGFSYKANEQWQIVGDYKRINWGNVMKSFKMTFDASATQADPRAAGFAGTQMNMEFLQNWKDQNVFMLGASYRVSDPLTVRFGVNLANNPVPDQFMSPLFPAIIKNHIAAGFGYAFNKAASLDFSLTHAPKVTATNSWSANGGTNQTTTHSQTNWQLMFSYRY